MANALSLEEEIEICISSGLSPTELFMVRLLFLATAGAEKYLFNYISNTSDGKDILKDTLINLKEKKIINTTFKIPKQGEPLKVKEIPFNKNFIKKYLRDSHELGREFFEAYPPFININGKLCSIKNFTKANLFSMDDFCNFYAKSIKNAKITHDRVMETLEYAKEHNLINYSIIEFLASQKYYEIEYIRNSGDINGYNNTELL
ncbi:MAG: hypothetical protein PF569_02415 [Candidatus Woesearchaeota archaeon]|jgi:hypothetical protein|nr:hypothetical protein [Candidatus Woesearchaeota archaeon]